MNWLARPGQHTDDWTVLYNAGRDPGCDLPCRHCHVVGHVDT